MMIGSVPAPLEWTHWKAAEALLEPARVLGGFASVIEPDEALWAVMDGDELLACATAWLGEGFVEVKLVGGRDHRRWLKELDGAIGAAAKEAGATWLQAFGRRGWVKALGVNGWDSLGETDGMTVYRREL
jgi:hypothetical protein